MKSADNSVQTLEKAFCILTAISKSNNRAKLNEITKMTGLNKTTAYRLLGSMISLGYVKKTNLSYCLSLKFLELSGGVVSNMSIVDISKPFLKRLCDLTGETVHLVTEDEAEIVYIHKEENTNNSLRMVSAPGLRRPMYCTAVGKSILAGKSDEEIREIWYKSGVTKHTQNTITEFELLIKEIEKVRKTGYAFDNEENEAGIKCVAAAINSLYGSYAFSVSGPAFRMTDEKLKEVVPAVLDTALCVSKEVGLPR